MICCEVRGDAIHQQEYKLKRLGGKYKMKTINVIASIFKGHAPAALTFQRTHLNI